MDQQLLVNILQLLALTLLGATALACARGLRRHLEDLRSMSRARQQEHQEWIDYFTRLQDYRYRRFKVLMKHLGLRFETSPERISIVSAEDKSGE